MARQFQYQSRFVPLANPEFDTHFQAVYPDEVRKRKRRRQSIIERIDPPEFDGYFGAVHPSTLVQRNKRSYLDSVNKFNEAPAAVVAPDLFSVVYPDFIQRARPKNLATEYSYSPLLDLVTTPFFSALFPDEASRAKSRENNLTDYSFFTLLDIPPPPAPDFGRFQDIPDFLFNAKKSYPELPNFFKAPFTPTFFTDNYLSLIEFFEFRTRLDVKKAVDSGVIAASSADVGGTTVTFNRAFKDVESIVGTVQEVTEFIVVIDFVDVPNPTSFKVLVFNTAGTRVSKTVYWVARGII